MAYNNFLRKGTEQFATKFLSVEKVYLDQVENGEKVVICIKYPDRTTKMAMDYCLPIVLLFAWQFALFFDSRISKKTAFKFFAINFAIVFILQFLFPLLLFNHSHSKIKTTMLFMGFQIFGFIIFFLILKDSILIRLQLEREKHSLPVN